MIRSAAAIVALMVCGVTTAATINVPVDYSTIQEAIDAASNGDEILVAPGTYTSSNFVVVNMLGKAITLRASGTPAQTIIDGQGTRQGISCYSGEGTDTLIEGFTITNCLGGIRCDLASAIFTGCTISGNTGGGVYCYSWGDSGSTPTITDCTITNNTASYGGGIYWEGSDPTITGCTISGNTANYSGGGIYCFSSSYSNSTATITGCTISDNTAGSDGGGIYCSSSYGNSTATITGCTISDNTAGSDGGGIYCSSFSYSSNNTTITGCTISDNTAGSDGGGIYCSSSSNHTLTDTVVCGNAPENIYGLWTDGGGVCLAYSCQDSDGNGVPDKCDGSVGDGIHEVPSEYATVQEAINAAGYGDTVLVAPGTYTGTGDWVINPLGKAITIKASGTPEETILDGEGARRVVRCSNGEGADTIFDGFTLQNGRSPTNEPEPDNGGVGMRLDGASPQILNCTFMNNDTGSHGEYYDINGAAVMVSAGLPTFTACTFLANTASGVGGGIYCENFSAITCTDCTFRANIAKKGAAVYLTESSTASFATCDFIENSATWYGGALYTLDGCLATFTDCNLLSNVAGLGGGGIYGQCGDVAIDGGSIRMNVSVFGGGIAMNCGSASINNVQFRDNDVGPGSDIRVGSLQFGDVSVTGSFFCGSENSIYGPWNNLGGNIFYNSCDVPCDADISGDGLVDRNDIVMIIALWGLEIPSADIDGDGFVDVGDLLILLENWGPCP